MTTSEPKWTEWMRGMGRYTRRLRELTGLSQAQLAQRAGVSQGAVSRLEAGRAVNAPLIVVMQINSAMRRALSELGPEVVGSETQRIMELPADFVSWNEARFDAVSAGASPLLNELVRLFWQVPERQREDVVAVVRAVVGLTAPPERAGVALPGGSSPVKVRARRVRRRAGRRA